MSKYSFYRFGLTILFASINLLPMHNHRLSKSVAYSRNTNTKEQQYKEVLLSSPSSVPYFKQQSIALQNNAANQYSLIFNRNQQPCVTQYLLEGKPVAKLIQIDDEINFESTGYRTYNFSLQIPYRAGSLTVNTQGQFIFEKKIDAHSACLMCKAVDFRDEFFSSNGLIVEADSCKSHAQLTCSDLLFKGKEFEIMPKSSLSTHNSLILTAQSAVLNDGAVDCKKESFIKSFLFKNPGTFTSHNMRFDGNKVINQGTLTISDTFHCASKLFEHSGMLDVSNNCIIKKGDIFSSTASSVWNVGGDWKAFFNFLSLNGSFSVKNLYVVGRNFTSERPLHCIAENASLKLEEDMTNAGVIKVLGLLDVDSKNIKLEKTSSIMVDNANLQVSLAIENEGTVSVKDHLSAHARSISNAGKIETSSGTINADRYYYNKILSTLSAKNNLTINTPLSLNVFGLTHAQQLTINSAIGFNALGIYAAKNIGINSLLSLNTGLLLPKFSTFSEMYSRANLWGLGESLFIKYVPFYGIMYAALKNIQGVYHQGKTLCSEVGSFRRQKSIGTSDVIALLCSIKIVLSSARQTFNLGRQSYNLLSDSLQSNNPQSIDALPEAVAKPLPTDNEQNLEPSSHAIAQAKDIAQQAASAIMSHHAPSVNTCSIVDSNYGGAIGVNNSSSSLFHRNSGISLYVQNTIDTRYGKNTGYLAAHDLNINATSSYESDSNICVSNGNIAAHYVATKGPINAFGNITLQGKRSANIQGDVTAKKIAVKSDGHLKIDSHLTSVDTHLHAKEINQHGIITAQHASVNGDKISNYGTVKAPKIIVTRAHLPRTYWYSLNEPSFFDNQGNLEASEQLYVEAGDIHLRETSQASAPNAYFKADGHWQNDGNITAEHMVLDGERDITNSGFLQASKIIINQAKLDNTSWAASGRVFRNQGNIQAFDLLSVDAQNIHLGGPSQVSAPNAYFKSNGEWQNAGNIDAEQLTIDAQKDMTNSGFLKADKLIIAHSGPDYNGWLKVFRRKNHYAFLDQGNIQVSERLLVDAKDIQLHKTSQISAPNAFFKSGSNWKNDGTINAEQLILDAQRDVTNCGFLQVSNQLAVAAHNIHLNERSQVSAPNAFFTSSGNWKNDGQLNTEQCRIHSQGNVINNGEVDASQLLYAKGKNILFQPESKVKAKDASYKADKNVVIDGVMDVEKGSVEAGGKVRTIGKIGASNQLDIKAKDIAIETKSHVSAPTISLKATEGINNHGEVSTSDLFVHAKYVGNSGKITSDNKAHIKADRYFWNQFLGSIDVENDLTIDALVALNTLGSISADSMCINSIVDVNLLGVYQGNNICQNSFISYNKGLLIPKFKSLGDLINVLKKNKLRFAESFVFQFSPRLAKVYALSKSVAMCFSKDEKKGSLWHRAKALKNHITDLSSKEDLCVSDVVPALCQGKNLLTSTLQTGIQAYEVAQEGYQVGPQIYQGGQHAYQTTQNYLNSTSDTTESFTARQSKIARQIRQGGQQAYQTAQNCLNSVSDTIEKSLPIQNNIIPAISTAMPFIGSQISTAASIAGPQLSRNSLLDCNAGVMLGVNGNCQSLYNMNSGISLFANNNSVSMIWGSNTGLIGGGNVSINAAQSYVSDGILAAANISMIANDLEITGNAYAFNNVLLRAHRNAVIDREIKAKNIAIQAKNLLIKDNASIDSQNTTNVVATKKLLNKGTINGKQTVVKGNTVILGNGSNILTHGDDGQAAIIAQELHLKNGSCVDANTALIDAQSIRGSAGNTIASRQGTRIKTNHINNQGTIDGGVALDFNGDATQLEAIGTLDQLVYSGTLDDNIADRLANGHNELLNVNTGGAVIISAQQQDVHLKEQHNNMPHTLHVQTKGGITCDQDLSSEKSIWLQAQGDVHHASIKSQGITALIGRNISSEGHVTRETCGKNYTDTCEESNVSGQQVIILAQQDIHYKATHVDSGIGGTQVYAGGRLIADILKTQEGSITESLEPGRFRWSAPIETITVDQITTSVPCAFTSEGATHIVAGNAAELHGTIFASKGGTFIQGTPEYVPTYDTHSQIKETKQAGKVIEYTELTSQTLKPITINDGTSPVIISDHDVSLYLECSSPSITIDAPAVELLVAQQETEKVCLKDTRWFYSWDRGTRKDSHDVVFDPSYSGTINTNAQTIHIEHTKGSVPAIINATGENPLITRLLMEDLHTYKKESLYNRPTPALMSVVALSIAIAMQSLAPVIGVCITTKLGVAAGVASELATQTTLGAMNALCFDAASALLHCNGDFRAAAKKLASMETIHNIAVTALTAATTAGAHKILDKIIPAVPQTATMSKRLLSAAPRELINGGIRVGGDIAQGKNPKEAAKNRAKSAVANTIGAAASGKIGQAYGEGKIGPGTHKLLHASVGAIEGGIIDGPNGAIAGAIGAGVAEVVADIAAPKPPSIESMQKLESKLGRRLTQNEFACEWNKQSVQYLRRAHSVGDASKMIAATVAILTNQDMDIAYNTATKAVDHNFLILAMYGVAGASIAYSAYQIHTIYEQEGAVEALKHLGIEVAYNTACLGAGRVAFRVGCKIYPSARVAISAALDSTPALKLALGNVTESLITAAEKLAGSSIGKQAASFNQYIKPLETHLINFENKIADKVGNVTKPIVDKAIKVADKTIDKVGKHINPSFAKDLVEQVAPGSVLNQVEKQLAEKSTSTLALPAPDKILSLPAPVANESVKGFTSVLNQDVSLSMAEMAKEHLNTLGDFEAYIENLATQVSKKPVGRLLEKTPLLKIPDLDFKTQLFYNSMREASTDIDAICKNTGISRDIINRIKQHVFVEEHILRHGVGRFFPDADMAAAWNRLIENKYVYSDLKMLQHEYAESLIMQGLKVAYDDAHYLVNKLYDWDSTL